MPASSFPGPAQAHHPMKLHLRERLLDLSHPQVMGILNVTPDSFSDGGRHRQIDAALRRADEMQVEGAAIIDVGGESTRPGASPVSIAEELERVLPVIESLRSRIDLVISIDTLKPEVMDQACRAGAHLVNDVRALQNPGALEVVARHGVAVCLMHMQGEPRSMQASPQYTDVVPEVEAFLQERIEACEQAGIGRDRLLIDPGFGFGKALPHNLALLGDLARFKRLGCPLLVGLSRKSMFQQLLGLPLEQRLAASLAAASIAAWQGASIIRAHDVRPTVEALRVVAAARQIQESLSL